MLPLLLLFCCSPKTKNISKLSISSAQRKQYANQLANAPVSELIKNDFEDFYLLSLIDLQKTNPKLRSEQIHESNSSLLEKNGYKNVPIAAYTLDFNSLRSTSAYKYSDKLVVNDTIHAQFVNYKNNDILGIVYACKRNNQWEAYQQETNERTVNPVDSSINDSSPTVTALKEAYKYSNNVFIITWTKPTIYPLTKHVVGFVYNGHINIILFYYGRHKYDTVKNWLLDDKRVLAQ